MVQRALQTNPPSTRRWPLTAMIACTVAAAVATAVVLVWGGGERHLEVFALGWAVLGISWVALAVRADQRPRLPNP